MSLQFDYDEFYTRVFQAGKEAFEHIHAAYAHETIYHVGLLTWYNQRRLVPFFNTEEQLMRDARVSFRRLHQPPHNRVDSTVVETYDELVLGLRYKPTATSYYPTEFEASFEAVQTFVSARKAALDTLLTQHEAYQAHRKLFIEVCLRALETLEAEGIFGRGAARERRVVNLYWTNDQTEEEQLTFARRLNPSSIFARYEQERHAWMLLKQRSTERSRQKMTARHENPDD